MNTHLAAIKVVARFDDVGGEDLDLEVVGLMVER